MKEIRINMNDILSSGIKEQILNKIKNLHSQYTLKKVVFWRNENFINENEFNILPIVQFTNKNPKDEFVWFDIISKNNKSRNKYFYQYNKSHEIIHGLNRFEYVMNTILNKKNGKKNDKTN